jgi:hypothetical protein
VSTLADLQNAQVSSDIVLGAPPANAYFSLVSTGSSVIKFGGYIPDGNLLVTASRANHKFDPSTGTWSQLASAPRPRVQHVAVWTGSRMVTWGGREAILADSKSVHANPWGSVYSGPLLTDFQIYEASTNSWTTVTASGAPTARNYQTAVWSGNEMLVWGGGDFSQYHVGNCRSDGGRYNPQTNTWAPISSIGAPSARCGHVAVWTGSEMIVWGGYSSSDSANPSDASIGGSPGSMLYDGAKYNPTTDTWTPIPSSPIAITSEPINGSNVEPVGVWNGSDLVVWTGREGQIYSPSSQTWSALTALPFRTWRTSLAWTGSEYVFLGTRQWDISGPGIQIGFVVTPQFNDN